MIQKFGSAVLMVGALLMAFAPAGLARGREGGGHSYSAPRFSGGSHYYGRPYVAPRYYGRGYYGRGYYGGGFALGFAAPYYGYGYAPGYFYDPGYIYDAPGACSPGAYDQYGNWVANPNCSAPPPNYYNPY